MSLDPITAGIDLATAAIKRIWPDKSEEQARELATQLQIVQGQLDINKTEAASASVFVAAWRPFVGWVCGTGFAVQFVVGPLAEWGSALAGHPIKFPQMDMATMMPLLFGMLGLGAYRSVEKVKGVA